MYLSFNPFHSIKFVPISKYFAGYDFIKSPLSENIFKSIGLIEITDQYNNTYKFSQIYIDTKKREVLGTDIKAFLNDDDFKINSKNNPRIFANTLKLFFILPNRSSNIPLATVFPLKYSSSLRIGFLSL